MVSAYYLISGLFMLFNAGGLQLMGWLTGSEIYPLAVRGAGTSAQSATLWGTNLIITLTLLPILEAIGAGATMWMYGIFNVIAWVFIFRRMPELTGHSLEQIEQQLHFGKFRPKDFANLREEGQFGLHYHPQSAQGLMKEQGGHMTALGYTTLALANPGTRLPG